MSQVSEDHCWLNMDAEGRREGTIEVTTDNAAKRALPVEAAAWQGWLYSGGHAPLCSPQVATARLRFIAISVSTCPSSPFPPLPLAPGPSVLPPLLSSDKT